MSDEQPLFLDPGIPADPPVYDRSELKIGDEVVIVNPGGFKRESVSRARLVSSARVWAYFESTAPGSGRTWDLRLDDQTDGKSHYPQYSDRFYTLAQWRWREANRQARRFLVDQGVDAQPGRPWYGHEIELARLIWPARKERKA